MTPSTDATVPASALLPEAPNRSPSRAPRIDCAQRLRQAIDRAGNLLPTSGPITAFVFLNALQALEDLPFAEGVVKGARLFDCQAYLREDQYRERMARGDFGSRDLAAVVRKDLGTRAFERIATLGTRFDLRMAMLESPLRHGPTEELRWFVIETDALTHLRDETPAELRGQFVDETRHWVMRDLRGHHEHDHHEHDHRGMADRGLLSDLIEQLGEGSIEDWNSETWEALSLHALWRVCRRGVQSVRRAPPPLRLPLRHRDVLLAATGEDSDARVHEVLIRFCAAFADQGLAAWAMPYRELGFYKAFFRVYQQATRVPDRWQRNLATELTRLEQAGLEPLDSIIESLQLLGVDEDEWEDYITATTLALRGWASMIWQMEVRGDRVPLPAAAGTLLEFIAVRLILERLALADVASACADYDGRLDRLREVVGDRVPQARGLTIDQRAFLVFQLAQVLGWCPPRLFRLSPADWSRLLDEIDAFSGLERRRIFHTALERRFRRRTLDALSVYTQRPIEPTPRPRFQAVFCIDTREESFRRHLEEIAPDVQTFSAAGFFGVAMYYRGAADAHFAALCPIVVRPKHWVVEDVVYTFEGSHRRRAMTRRALGTASHQVHMGSRSVAGGALLTAGLGVLASIPLVARVLFPRLTSRVRRLVGGFVQPPPITRLRLERVAETPGPDEDGIGFTVEEMANISERMLREIGFTSYSRLVMFLGHGSFCLNNPHESAYDCGACSGSAGSPNARALAAMLNDLRVRQVLAERGLNVPSDTFFLGGLHNTCNDTITFLDLDLLPKSHLKDFEAARATLEATCERNAHERCRRFESAPLDMTFAAARRHVEQRSQDLSQTRPEFGNASNAVCIVGRRARTRGLYLDRRSFLVSYDPTLDDADHAVLARILGAVVPVCSGINLTYFFSYVDSPGWGCGTKLPHNVTSLLGVMDGAASDLRLGLPWQGVEIHEPVRLLFVIEATPDAMLGIMDRNPMVGRILRNGWAQLAVLDPNSSQIMVFRDGSFHHYSPESTELPRAPSSTDWYRGWRHHLEFAQIAPELASPAVEPAT